MPGRIVGRVAELWRFPVKSMAGERRAALELRWTGLHGDRQYAFHRTTNPRRFPWLTGREVPALVLHRAAFRDPEDPRNAPVEVETPQGTRLPLDAPALHAALQAEAGEPVALIQIGRGAFDAMPVSIGTTAGLAQVGAAHGKPLDARRFRLNILIESELAESALAGLRLGFGEAPETPALLVAEGIQRCAMITLDPETAARDATVLRTVAQCFNNEVGVYAGAARTGWIRQGDVVRVLG